MEERSIKRLAVMLATAIVIILVLKHIGLKMAASAKLAHQSQVAARQVQAPASTPAQSTEQTGDETDALTAPEAGDTAAASAPETPVAPDAAPLAPEAASAPDAPPPAPDRTAPDPSTTDPTVSIPPASLNAN